jgi:MFS family permease
MDGTVDPPPNGGDPDNDPQNSPLPKKQLAMLAVIALCEQTALNSISPYLPKMTSTFPEVDVGQIGLYVGTIGSSFALAQFATNFFWGWLSDRIGRKPVVMMGTILTAACFVAFGFCRTLWQAILVQALMGLVNGNQGVISTCLGEITDRSNQSKAFVYLPVIYGIGGITGPALGGLLVFQDDPFRKGLKNPYPYLLPNLFSAMILIIDLVLTGFFLEESLEEAKDLPPLKKRVGNLFSWLWQFTGAARHPTYIRPRFHRNSRHRTDVAADGTDDEATDNESETQSLLSIPEIFMNNDHHLTSKEVLNRDTIILLATYLIFQLSNISFNSLYPIFASSLESSNGRDLSPEEIGLSLSFAGIVTIVFQVGIFGKLKEKMGNKRTYRAGLFLFFLSMIMMPWVGKKEDPAPFGWGTGKVWLWIELGFILLVKTVAAVGGLTSALLLVSLIRYLLSIPFSQELIANHEHNRSPTQRPTTLSSARSTASPKHSPQPAEQQVPSYLAVSSPLLLKSTLEVRQCLGVSLVVLRFWDASGVLGLEGKDWSLQNGMKRTEVGLRRMRIIARKMVRWGGGDKTTIETM